MGVLVMGLSHTMQLMVGPLGLGYQQNSIALVIN